MQKQDRLSLMLTKSFLFFSPRAKHGRAYALRALGLLLADNALTVGRGKTF